jgi:hypothetical protein
MSEADVKELVLGGPEGKYGHELLPAEEDSEGNWGMPTNGIQMSARFYKTNFTVGDPISVVILLRNVGQTNLPDGGASWVNYPYLLTLRCDEELIEPVVPAVKPGPHDGSAWGGSIVPGTQARDVLRIDKIFDLSRPGAYKLTAERGGFRDDGTRVVRGSSGVAEFWIIPKTRTQTNAPPASPLSGSVSNQ